MFRHQFDITTTNELTNDQLDRLTALVDSFLKDETIECPRGFDLWNVEECDPE